MEPTREVEVRFTRRYRLVEHACPVCGAVFQAPRVKVYCSLQCAHKAEWQRKGAEYNERRRIAREKRRQTKEEAQTP